MAEINEAYARLDEEQIGRMIDMLEMMLLEHDEMEMSSKAEREYVIGKKWELEDELIRREYLVA